MKIRHSLVRARPGRTAIALASSLLLALAACETPVALDIEGSISGSVTIGSGRPLTGVTVTLDPGGQSVVTGTDGSYAFNGLTPGAYTVTISGFPAGLGFSTTTQSTSVPSAGGTVRNDFAGTWPPVVAEAVAPPSGVVGVEYSLTLSATGGDGNYTWSVSTGSLPEGLALGPSDGVINGSPTTASTVSFTGTATSGDGQSDDVEVVISIYPVLDIAAPSLPDGVVGTAYTATLSAEGGDDSYMWSVVSGALPAGLSLNGSTGSLSGAGSAAGQFTFTVRVTSGDEQVAEREITISTWAELEIEADPAPSGVVATPYAHPWVAVGGSGSNEWAVVSGTLPDGLTLNPSTGELSGTPATAGSFDFSISVTSSDGQSDEAAVTVETFEPLQFPTPNLASGIVGSGYDQALAANGGDGQLSWSVTAGTPPTGLILDTGNGTISGTATTAESQTFTVRVESGDGQTAAVEITISVWDALAIESGIPPSGVVAEPYAHLWTAVGGSGANVWAVASGTLPDGLMLDPSNGELSGTPTNAGSLNFAISVTSADGQSDEVAATVATFEPISFPLIELPSGVVGSMYDESLAASGGDGQFSWTITEGTLPQGLTLGANTGDMTGTTSSAGSQTFTVHVESGDGQSDEQSLTINVQPVLAITTPTVADGEIDIDYDGDIDATGGDGDYAWALTVGSLPTGMTLDPGTGALVGAPTGTGNFDFTAEVTSGDGQTAEGAFALRVTLNPTSACSSFPDSEVVAFADEIVEADVRSALGLGPMADITCGALPPLTSLFLSTGVSSLAGVQNLTELQALIGSTGTIDDLSPVAGLTGLNSLSLVGYSITDLSPIGSLPSLASLTLDNNQISTLDQLTGLTQLQWLTMRDNLLVDLDGVENATSLTGLTLTRNQLTDLSALNSLTGLTRFEAGQNPLSDLSALSGHTGLLDVGVRRTQVSDLTPLAALTLLEELDIDSSNVFSLAPLTGLTALADLAFSYNQITDLSPLSGKTSIWRLRLEGNPISDFSALSTLTGLRTIGLGETGITDLTPVVALPSLTWLSVPMNGITDISVISTMSGLEFLNVRGNALTDISAVSTLTSIRDLVLDQNPDLSNVQPILDNPGVTGGDRVFLRETSVSCADVALLEATGADIRSDCGQ